MIRNKSYIFSGDMQVITEILDGKTFHQRASRIDEFYRLKFGDTCITRKNIRFISYITNKFDLMDKNGDYHNSLQIALRPGVVCRFLVYLRSE